MFLSEISEPLVAVKPSPNFMKVAAKTWLENNIPNTKQTVPDRMVSLSRMFLIVSNAMLNSLVWNFVYATLVLHAQDEKEAEKTD
ncbi:hypothetical protein [Bdellovibrio sp. HCB2-146]|uniref:hypothetical protein n=1 Tax=Bdellovibrio sp. HCB2-146 TaxID=3394362 RepID=UPI0039BD7500